MEQFSVEWRDIGTVKPYPKNAKKHDDKQVANVAESIKQFGWQQPIVCDADGVIIIGHCRLLAAKKLGLKKVPVKTVDNLSEEQVKKLRALDNKLNESDWDFDLLAEDIGELDFSGFDIDWGIPADEEETEIVEDEAPEVDEENEPITKLGDIWQLGRHKLICGDSTDRATVERLMDGKKADMVFTDPPYGVGFESKGVLNDNQNSDELLEFNKKWIPISIENTKDNGSWYCWGVDTSVMDIYAFILRPLEKAHKLSLRNLLTWDKGLGQNQNDSNMRSYPAADEKCLFVMLGWEQTVSFSVNQDDYNPAMDKVRLYMAGEAERLEITPKKIKEVCGVGMYSHWFSKSQFSIPTREQYNKLQAYYAKYDGFKKEYDELKKEYDELKKEYDELKNDFYSRRAYFDNTHDNMNNVWHFSRPDSKEREATGGHATPKPIALCSRAIKSSSREGEIVLDLFGGSGSTLIACEQLKRKAYLMELEPKWCDVIIKRWENLTGEKAVKIS